MKMDLLSALFGNLIVCICIKFIPIISIAIYLIFTTITIVYKLQQESPKPQPVFAPSAVSGCPFFYGLEYHGAMNHKEANSLLTDDGNYLIRLSTSSDDKMYTLSLK